MRDERVMRGLILCGCLLCAGCADFKLAWPWSKPKVAEQVAAPDNPAADSAAFRDTIAEVAWVEGLRLMRVQGYGLVAGLGTRGSRECPREIRKLLLQDMYKMKEFATGGDLPVSPEQIIDDPDTAVVTVEGEIPPAALAGDSFDLTVRALPGTQTTSLEGGRLYTCDLRLFNEGREGTLVAGQILAAGAGPVFINPWSQDEKAATSADPRLGYVLGGGRVKKERRIRLVIEKPSYRTATAIADRINARFTEREKVAEAQSPSHVRVRIPKLYADRPAHFLALVRHLFLPTLPGFLDQRAAELAKEMAEGEAPHEDIALAFEGIGRTALPLVRKLYADGRDHVRYHAALAGVRLGDDMALETLSELALQPRCEYRMGAVRALAESTIMSRALPTLRKLVDDEDPRMRVAAYEGLLAHRDKTVQSHRIGGDNFMLDVIESSGTNMVYARRQKESRIALFGAAIECSPPIFYTDNDGMITMNAEVGDTHLTLLRKTRASGGLSPPVLARTGLGDLIPMLGDDPIPDGRGSVHGLAIQYSLVVKALADLCRSSAINAQFMLEQDSVPEIFGPLKEPGRKESEL